MTPKIIIPHVRNPSDNTGLITIAGSVYARYTEDGKRKTKRLGSLSRFGYDRVDRTDRDEFYATLIANGATFATRGDFKAKAAANPDRYIRQRAPWVVTIKGKIIAEFGTKREAKQARDRHLGIP